MKIAVGIAAVALLMGTPVWAADMAVKAPPPAPPPGSTWAGFYVGGNGGGAWGNFDPQSSTVFNGSFTAAFIASLNALGASQSIRPSGFTGGFETGYNWQFDSVVLGVEGDIEAVNLKGNSTVNGVFGGNPQTMTANASTNWLATTRGRLGYAADNLMYYVTGGAAFTTLKATFGYVDAFPDLESPSSLSTTRVGYVVGGGIQAAFWQRWSVRAEYLYVDFGRVSTIANLSTFVPTPPQPITNSIDLKASIARLGLDYRFN